MDASRPLVSIGIHRSTGGASASLEALAQTFGLRGRQARNPFGIILRSLVADILWGSPYRMLPLSGCVGPAWRAAAGVYRRHYRPLRRHNRRVRWSRRLRSLPLAARVWERLRTAPRPGGSE